jgi:hypothetical protein
LGLTLTRLGKPAEGELYLREVLEIRKRVLPADDVSILITESSLGECLTAEKRYKEAETLLAPSYEGMKSKLGEQDPRTVEARQRLQKLHEMSGNPNLRS